MPRTPAEFPDGTLTGSLNVNADGLSSIVAGANIFIVTQSNGQLVISAITGSASASLSAIPPTSDQLGELIFAAVTASVYNKSLPVTTVNGWLVNDTGLMLVTTSSTAANYLPAFSTTQSSTDPFASYLVLGATSSLSGERVLNVTGSSLILTDNGAGSTAFLDIASTGSAAVLGVPIQVNNKGQVTSGSTSWFGQNLNFVTSSTTFLNTTTTLQSALAMTSSNITNGLYRLGWSFSFRANTTTNAFKSSIVVGTSGSNDIFFNATNTSAAERYTQSGFTYIMITGSIQTFDMRISLSTAATNTTASVYERALELWKIS